MVYLSLMCRCPGKCENSSGLGRVKGCRRCYWRSETGQTGLKTAAGQLGFVVVRILGLLQEVVVLVVGLESLQVVNLLCVLQKDRMVTREGGSE
jgi:hypothetical protein